MRIERDKSASPPPSAERRVPGAVALCAAIVLLALSAVYLGTGVQQNLLVAGPGFTNHIGNGIGTDFPVFYAAAVETSAGRARSVYDMDALHAAHKGIRGVEVKRYAWAYPPTFLLLIVALSLLPLVPAMWTWLTVTTGLLVVAALGIMQSPLAVVTVLLFPGLTASLITGPTGTLSAALTAMGLVLCTRRPRLAGVFFGLLTVKPHMAALVPICLFAAREREVLTAFLLTAAMLVAGSLVAFGSGPWIELVRALPRHMTIVAAGEAPWQRMPTVFVALRHGTHVIPWAWAAQVATSVAVVVVCIWVWRASRDASTRALTLTAGMPLVGPYAYDYDTCVLIVPVLYLAQTMAAGRASRRDIVLFAWLWLTPVTLWLASAAVGQQIGPLLLGVAIAEGARRVVVERRGTAP